MKDGAEDQKVSKKLNLLGSGLPLKQKVESERLNMYFAANNIVVPDEDDEEDEEDDEESDVGAEIEDTGNDGIPIVSSEDEDRSVIGSDMSFMEEEAEPTAPVHMPVNETMRNDAGIHTHVEIKDKYIVLYESKRDAFAVHVEDEFIEPLCINNPSGILHYPFKNISQLKTCVENKHFYSHYIYVRGIPFRIMILPRETGSGQRPGMTNRTIGYFVQCTPEMKSKWNMRAVVFLKMKSHIPNKEPHARRIVHGFHPGENDWGYAQFIQCELLEDEKYAYYNAADDSIEFFVHIMADPPKYNLWSVPLLNQEFAGHVGIKNLGSTCYFNSLVQVLFSVKKLRKLVYAFDSSPDAEYNPLVFEMQLLFMKMQYSDHSVDPSSLGQMLWSDPYSQEDVHDMFMKLIDRIDQAFQKAGQNDFTKLFQTEMSRYVFCPDIKYRKTLSTETSNCVLLNLRGDDNRSFETLSESLQGYVAGNKLEGQNKYEAGEYGLQVAIMGYRFVNYAPILVFTLQRSTFGNTYAVKVNDRFEFKAKMNMTDFMTEEARIGYNGEFVLHSVVVHYGESGCGHYVTFLNTNLRGKPRWIKCDDELVFRVAEPEAVASNFGVREGSKEQDTGTAYVLTYLKEDQIDDLMCDVSQNDIHPNIKDKLLTRFLQDHTANREFCDEKQCHDLLVVTDDLLREHSHCRFDLIDFKAENPGFQRVLLPKDMLLGDIYTELRRQCSFLENVHFRVFLFRHAHIMRPQNRTRGYKGGLRPCTVLPVEGVYANQLLTEGLADSGIYIRIITDVRIPPNVQSTNESLIFVKVFNRQTRRLNFAGSVLIPPLISTVDLRQYIHAALPDIPNDPKLQLYAEVGPFDIRPLDDDHVVSDHNGFDGDGSIVVAELCGNDPPEFLRFWSDLSRTATLIIEQDTDVFALNAIRHDSGQFRINAFIDTPITDVLAQLAAAHPQFKAEQFLIWKAGPVFDKPAVLWYEQMSEFTVADILGTRMEIYDPRDAQEFLLRYAVFDFDILKDQLYLQHRVFVLSPDHLKINPVEVLFNARWTVAQFLDYCRNSFPFSDDGSQKLRLLLTYRTGHDKTIMGPMSRVHKVVDEGMLCEQVLKMINDDNYSLRLEEVPVDQVALGPNETLVPLVHIEHNTAAVFGISVMVKAKNGERFGEMKSRVIYSSPGLAPEFAQTYNFYVYEGAMRRPLLKDDTIVAFDSWRRNEYPLIEHPVLAVQHTAPPETIKLSILL